jgi:hypothetical protein
MEVMPSSNLHFCDFNMCECMRTVVCVYAVCICMSGTSQRGGGDLGGHVPLHWFPYPLPQCAGIFDQLGHFPKSPLWHCHSSWMPRGIMWIEPTKKKKKKKKKPKRK